MSRIKSIRVACVNWCIKFTDAKGRYYDYVATMYASNEANYKAISAELQGKGWKEIETSDTLLTVFGKDRHIIRITKL